MYGWICASGNSKTFFLARSSFDSEDVIFPPAVVGQSVYQSVVIRNNGAEPTVFNFEEDSDK